MGGHWVLKIIGALSLLLVTLAATFAVFCRSREPRRGADAISVSEAVAGAVVSIDLGGRATCLGVLVDPERVVTAKHCLRKASTFRVEVANAQGVKLGPVRAVLRHPELDAAVLSLAHPVEGAIPLELVSDFTAAVPSSGQGVGAGMRSEAVRSKRLHLVPLAYQVVGEELSASYPAEGLCAGDSGGPLLVRTREGKAAVLGVLRGGPRHCHGPDNFVRSDRIASWLNTAREASGTVGPEKSKEPRAYVALHP